MKKKPPVFGLHTGPNAREIIVSADAASFSTLHHFARSALHGRQHMLHPKPPTEAMDFGNAVHMAILEPDRIDKEIVEGLGHERRSEKQKAAWAAFEAEHAGKIILDTEEIGQVYAMRDAVWSHPFARALLSAKGYREAGAIWRDEETGEPCKTLMDLIANHAGWTWVADVKTCKDASAAAFAKTVVNAGYHAQATMMLDGLHFLAPRDRRFVWIAVEKEEPFAVAVHELGPDGVFAGRARWREWLARYAEARRTNQWPGYAAGVQQLKIPVWEMREVDDG
jgi:hypothetical protein